MDQTLLSSLAQKGIVARRQELEAELARLDAAERALTIKPVPRRRRTLTDAQRAEIGKRMKRYWAARRKQNQK